MSRGPRRLMDDPDFQWETGCDLADEAGQVGGYELASMKEAVLAKVSAAAAAGSAAVVGDGVPTVHASGASSSAAVAGWIKPLAFATAGVATVGTAFWLGVVAGPGLMQSPVAPEPTPQVEPVEPAESRIRTPFRPMGPPALAAEPEGSAPEAVDAEPVAQAESRSAYGRERALATPSTPSPALEPAEMSEGAESAVLAAPPEPAPSPVAMLNQAMRVCEAMRTDRARAGCFRDSLHQYPGVADDMVELAWVNALRDAGDVEGTAALANRMQQDPAHRLRYAALRQLEAESLAKLGRCDHALGLARDLDRRVAEAIKKECRRRR